MEHVLFNPNQNVLTNFGSKSLDSLNIGKGLGDVYYFYDLSVVFNVLKA
jgi:hypothetical protein